MLFGKAVTYIGECLSFHPIISTVLLLLLAIVLSYYAIRPRNLPPGPWGLPWYGSSYLLSDNVHHDFNNLSKKYGDIFTLMMGTRPLIVLNSNRLNRECFTKRGDEFGSRPSMYCLDHMNLKDELFNVGLTRQWKERKAGMVRILRNAGFGSALVEDTCMTNFDKVFSRIAKKTPVSTTEPVQKLLAMTLAKVVYNGRYEYDSEELQTLMGLAMDWMASVYREGMALGYLADNVPPRITTVLYPAMMNNMRIANAAFQKFLIAKIHEHRNTLDIDNPRDIIDGYLVERGDDPELTDIALSSTILMLFPDGIDSHGSLMQFILFYLAYYPDWQRKVQNQIDEVCGDRRPTLADREKMPLVEATIYEVGRVASVVCLTIAHCPVRNTILEGYNIPKDSYILGNVWAAHMDAEAFPRGESFAPEMLIDSKGRFIRNDKIMMFGSGHRMCIGSQMVKNVTFLFVSNTLQRCNLSFPEGEPLPELGSRGGLIREPMPHKMCFTPRAE